MLDGAHAEADAINMSDYLKKLKNQICYLGNDENKGQIYLLSD